MKQLWPKMTCIFLAATVLSSPILGLADTICRCPDCARRVCTIMAGLCDCTQCSETSDLHSNSAEMACHGCTPPKQTCQDPDPDEHEHGPESKGCQCNAYVYTHGSALMPKGTTTITSLIEEFYQPIPTTFVTSGWVYPILHPPRSCVS